MCFVLRQNKICLFVYEQFIYLWLFIDIQVGLQLLKLNVGYFLVLGIFLLFGLFLVFVLIDGDVVELILGNVMKIVIELGFMINLSIGFVLYIDKVVLNYLFE